MIIKDRGNSKWNSLMLVKHRRMLEELKGKEENREKPEPDEQELERINRLLLKAIEEKLQVRITYYRGKRYYDLKGTVKRYLTHQNKIVIHSLNGEKIYLSTGDITNVKFK